MKPDENNDKMAGVPLLQDREDGRRSSTSITIHEEHVRETSEKKHRGWRKTAATVFSGPNLLGFLIIHVFLTLFYWVIFFHWFHGSDIFPHSQDARFEKAYVPYVGEPDSVMFEHEHSVYVGKPRAELDEAWEKLLWNSNIRVSEEEMANIPGRKSQAIPLPDGGYYASPTVYHNLHCIKRLHHYMYWEHYFPNITEEQHAANIYHNHHCLDMLRQSIMCDGDMQLLTMKWTPLSSIPTANFTSPHRCVNWQKLDEWAGSRRLDHLFEDGYLTHPTLGPAYPGGHGDVIGEIGDFGKASKERES